jgi:hypothetical protein
MYATAWFAIPVTVYVPGANVIVAPSLALLIAASTWALVDPAAQDHVVPLPEHCACAEMDPRIQITAARQANRRIVIVRLSGFWNWLKRSRKYILMAGPSSKVTAPVGQPIGDYPGPGPQSLKRRQWALAWPALNPHSTVAFILIPRQD